MEEEATRLHHLQFRKELENTRDAVAKLQAWCKELEVQVRNRQQVAEEQRRRIAELEEAQALHVQQVGNWDPAAEQRRERIDVLEATITRMHATRAWRTAECSVGSC